MAIITKTLKGMGLLLGAFAFLVIPAFAGANLILPDASPCPTSPIISIALLIVWLIGAGFVVGRYVL